MIPVFSEANDTIAYHMAMRQLIAKTDDSHATFFTPYTTSYFGNFVPPFRYRIAEGKAIVTGAYNDTLMG